MGKFLRRRIAPLLLFFGALDIFSVASGPALEHNTLQPVAPKPKPVAVAVSAPAPVAVPKPVNTLSSELIRAAWAYALDVTSDRPMPVHQVGSPGDDANRPIIVLDLGHGFKTSAGEVDDGVENHHNGMTEMAIINAVGASLRDILKHDGYDITLTRDPDKLFTHVEGDYKKSLAVRGFMPAFLGWETGRPVILLSLHVNDGWNGGAAYRLDVHGMPVFPASRDLAAAIASAYRIGDRGCVVNPGGRDYRGSFDNRMMHCFELAQLRQDFRGAATLLEMGNIQDPADDAVFEKALKNGDVLAEKIAAGVEKFVVTHFQPPSI